MSVFEDPFGSSVNHEDINRHYRTNVYDSIRK